jgi:hypothetical protein
MIERVKLWGSVLAPQSREHFNIYSNGVIYMHISKIPSHFFWCIGLIWTF